LVGPSVFGAAPGGVHTRNVYRIAKLHTLRLEVGNRARITKLNAQGPKLRIVRGSLNLRLETTNCVLVTKVYGNCLKLYGLLRFIKILWKRRLVVIVVGFLNLLVREVVPSRGFT
jgi:hypothetical protein